MNDSIKDMQKDISYINKAISDLLNDFAHRNNCDVNLELSSFKLEAKSGVVNTYRAQITAIYE